MSEGPRLFIAAILMIGFGLWLDFIGFERADREPPPRPVAEPGVLRVLTLEGPTSYQRSAQGARGYEVDLATAYAEDRGLTPRFIVHDGITDLIAALLAGEGDIAAAGLTDTEARRARMVFGPAYKNVREELVCRRGGVRPSRTSELGRARIAVVGGSSYVETLGLYHEGAPDLDWTEREAGSAMPLMRDVARGLLDCTVADSHLLAFARRRHPNLIAPMALTEDRPLAWAIAPGRDELEADLRAWFRSAHSSGLLQDLDERWYGQFQDFDYVDTARFVRRLDGRLPRYERYFRAAAAEHGFDWRLLAAQSYQESHWNPRAASPTGVRGLMMLTLSTAERVGVEDRLDPRQSIEGGADYLADLLGRVPDSVEGEDRLWFALAAYNVGMGHMYDARRLAERRGLNKDRWEDLRQVLPLLSDPEHYRTLRYGYARGEEPVAYVAKVREYHAMLRANRPE